MSQTLEAEQAIDTSERQFATFYVGNLLLGVDICRVQEINRQLDITTVPQAPRCVRGVINLRGEVTTVIDLKEILGFPATEITRDTRNLILNLHGESIGILVDKISDILTIKANEINPAPSNIDGIQGRFFEGVHTLESSILVILNITEALSEKHSDEAVKVTD